MKLLFLTLFNIQSINERNLYSDLMRKFRDEGHDVYILTPSERRLKQPTSILKIDGVTLLKIKILNIQKTNIVEKGISTLLIEHLFLAGIRKFIPDVKFDLILYSTPPITFTNVISFIKKRDNAVSYLLLKDIFPQNAVDLKMIRKGGLIHLYFIRKEKKLYQISDFIGCMSPANVKYVIKHNPEIGPQRIEENPNSIQPVEFIISNEDRINVRKKYSIPLNSTVFVYGGNLGKPQGIDFLIDVLTSNLNRKDIFFVIVGSGTEYQKINKWFIETRPVNVLLLSYLPKSEYDELIRACDIGLIFLDRRFTIPNFPSRILSYMENKMPILAATDTNTDLSKIIQKNNFGYSTENGNLMEFNDYILNFSRNKDIIREMGNKGFEYLMLNYTCNKSYSIIMKHFASN